MLCIFLKGACFILEKSPYIHFLEVHIACIIMRTFFFYVIHLLMFPQCLFSFCLAAHTLTQTCVFNMICVGYADT